MIIGVDPGITGGICLMDTLDRVIEVIDMPTMTLNGKKNQVNPAALAGQVRCWIGDKDLSGFTAVIEKVAARPGQGVSAMFNFGMGYGAVLGVMAAIGVPYILVTPQAWKKRAGLIKQEKDVARTFCQQLYPGVDLKHKNDIGRADAILIARFGRME